MSLRLQPCDHTGLRDKPRARGSAEVPTFCPLHGEQHLTDVLRVVAGALDGPVQSLPAVLRVPVGPGAENTELGPQGPSRRHGGGGHLHTATTTAAKPSVTFSATETLRSSCQWFYCAPLVTSEGFLLNRSFPQKPVPVQEAPGNSGPQPGLLLLRVRGVCKDPRAGRQGQVPREILGCHPLEGKATNTATSRFRAQGHTSLPTLT